jgi:DNA-binding transcriptional regulator YiaG
MRGSARGEMTPVTEDVTFMRGNERIERLAERPDLAEDVARVRRDMEDADRTYAMGLAALRQAADLTQVELARKLGVSQAAVSRIEQPHDLLLSTLNAYLQAVGGHARVIVEFVDGHEVDLDLSSLTATTQS